MRKELIRSTAPTFPEDEGFRFRHLLIRDAAYESLPKATRAELHEQFADWLSTHDLVEGDEIVGYHLEQAHRYRSELDGSDPALPELARRASDHLATAGRGALDRGDFNAGRSLFRRATDLLPAGDERRLALAPDYADALFESRATPTRPGTLLGEARERVRPASRERTSLVTRSYWARRRAALISDERAAWRRRRSRSLEEARRRRRARAVLVELSRSTRGSRFVRWRRRTRCERALAHLERAGTSTVRDAEPSSQVDRRPTCFGPTAGRRGDRARSRRSERGEHGALARGVGGVVLGAPARDAGGVRASRASSSAAADRRTSMRVCS